MKSITFTLDEMQNELLGLRTNRRFVMRCSQAFMIRHIENASSLEELAKFAKSYGLCDMCDLTALNMSAARIMLNCIVEVIYKFPQVRSKFNFIGSKKAYLASMVKIAEYDPATLKAFGIQHICDKDLALKVGNAMSDLIRGIDSKDSDFNPLAVAFSVMGIVDGIVLDDDDFGARKFTSITEELEYNVKSGFRPKGCNTVASVVYHEIGHLIDFLCDVSRDRAILAEYNGRTKQEIKSMLSGYAASSVQEFIAEGFAEFMSDPQPRQCAVFIMDAIKRCYQTRYA